MNRRVGNCLQYAMLGLIVSFAPKTSSADFIELPVQFGPQQYTLALHPEGTTVFFESQFQSFQFAKFNSSLGTLTSANLRFENRAFASMLGIQSGASSTNFVNGNMRITYTLTAPGISLVDDSIFFNLTPQASDPIFTINYGLQTSPVVVSLPSTSLSAYLGTGQVSAQLQMRFAQNAFSSSSSLQYQFTPTTETRAVLIYTYTAVPEPGSLLLLSTFASMRLLWRQRCTQKCTNHSTSAVW